MTTEGTTKGDRQKKKDRLPIENVEFQSPPQQQTSRHGRGDSLESFGDKDLGHAKQQSSAGSSKNNSNAWQYSPSPIPTPSGTANAASNAAYEYQQQQAYYAQQFYLQQQQQRYPGYVPWPAPGPVTNGGVSHPFFNNGNGYPVQQPQQQQQQQQHQPQQPKPHLNRRSTTGTAHTAPIKATLSQGSDQDDEYVALLTKNLAQVGGYGSLGHNNNDPWSNSRPNSNGRISPADSSHHSRRSGAPPPPPKSQSKLQGLPKPKHRRSQSEGHPLLKRNASKEKPPMSKSSPRFPSKTASGGGSAKSHTRSLSGSGILSGGLPSNLGSKPRHRRASSNASSIGAASVASEASFVSHTSNIQKSIYAVVDKESGVTELHYPNEHIYVCTTDNHPNLQTGKVYKIAVDEEAFEEYHRQAEDAMWQDDLDLMEEQQAHHQQRCGCKCHVCAAGPGCAGHTGNGRARKRDNPFGALPSNQFALAVDPTVYKRVLDEISQAQGMPCGLFFCGHHEDVAHPGIQIALVPVIVLFLVLGAAAYVLEIGL